MLHPSPPSRRHPWKALLATAAMAILSNGSPAVGEIVATPMTDNAAVEGRRTISSSSVEPNPLMRSLKSKSHRISSSFDEADSSEEIKRLLGGNNKGNEDGADLAKYSIKFQKCQYVKMYDDDIAAQGSSVFAMKQFIIYRICPSSSCSNGCYENYGEYVIPAQDYLEATAENNLEQFQNMCQLCNEYCNGGNGNNKKNNNNNNDDYFSRSNQFSMTCAGCSNQCMAYQNINQNGYVHATDYIQCQAIYLPPDDDSCGDDCSGTYVYVGPRCVKENKYSDKTAVRIGVFTDSNCWEPHRTLTIEEVLGAKVNYNLLKTSTSQSGCVSCMDQENDNHKQDDGGRTLEVCEQIYESSAKCESKHGFAQSLSQVNEDENQLKNEQAVCAFVDSLVWNSYDQYGEIEVNEVQDVYDRKDTKLQKWMLGILSTTIFAFAVYARILHQEIETGYPTLGMNLGMANPASGCYA